MRKETYIKKTKNRGAYATKWFQTQDHMENLNPLYRQAKRFTCLKWVQNNLYTITFSKTEKIYLHTQYYFSTKWVHMNPLDSMWVRPWRWT